MEEIYWVRVARHLPPGSTMARCLKSLDMRCPRLTFIPLMIIPQTLSASFHALLHPTNCFTHIQTTVTTLTFGYGPKWPEVIRKLGTTAARSDRFSSEKIRRSLPLFLRAQYGIAFAEPVLGHGRSGGFPDPRRHPCAWDSLTNAFLLARHY